jgi:hypothetical protein
MKLKTNFFFIVLISALTISVPVLGQNEHHLTTTLLPVKESGFDTEENKLLWIQNDPEKESFLQFDLSELPHDLIEKSFIRCNLRLIAKNVVYKPEDNPNTGGTPVIIKGWLTKDDVKAIISLSPLTIKNNCALNLKVIVSFREAVFNEYDDDGDKKFSLKLYSESHKASTLFYSSENFEENPSNIPRLVITYVKPPSLLETLSWSQHQQNSEHTGRQPWIPFRNPTGFSLKKIPVNDMNGSIADYPLIYRGNMYLVNKDEGKNYLCALNFKGKEIWREDIGTGTVQRSPVISRNGIFYVVTEDKIAGYDLNHHEIKFDPYPISGKLSDYTDLTIGNDGSLFLALKEKDVNYIYGFTPALKPFLKSGPFGKGQDKISTITVSPDGRKIFTQTPKGAVVIDITNPSQKDVIPLTHNDKKPWEYYHMPVAGPSGGVMVFSDFTSTANKGNVWGYDTKRIWNTSGTLIPQPVLGSNGFVYYIQDGALQRHKYDQISDKFFTDSGLNTTSNLVMDGANNIYFWDNGYLHGYKADGEALFSKIPLTSELKERKMEETDEGPEQFIRLMMGPDGTLWVNNKNGNSLYTFKPQYAADSDLTLKQDDIKTQTVYRATGTLAVGDVKIEKEMQILFQAQEGIGFAKGFAVEKGAALLCRTGF